MRIYKIGVYQICKNESQHVLRWYDSIKDEQDGIFVTDTGSTDGTLELLKSLPGVTVFEQKVIPWRFDRQRNIQLSNVPQEYDVVVWLDMDEIMDQGWRNVIDQMWNGELNTISCTRIDVEFNDTYRIETDMGTHKKFHRRHNIYWIKPIHEFPIFNNPNIIDLPEYNGFMDNIKFYHYPDSTKPRNYINQMLYWLSLDEFKNDIYLNFMLTTEYKKIADYENMINSTYKLLEISYQYKDLDTTHKRKEQMTNVQDYLLYKKSNRTEQDILQQLQWVLKQISEYPYESHNWYLQQKIYILLDNISMTYSYCTMQIDLYKQSEKYYLPILIEIQQLQSSQKLQFRKELKEEFL